VTERNGGWERAVEVPGTAALNLGGHASVSAMSCPQPGRCAVGDPTPRGTATSTHSSTASYRHTEHTPAIASAGLRSATPAMPERGATSRSVRHYPDYGRHPDADSAGQYIDMREHAPQLLACAGSLGAPGDLI
jgi:hypothetical protein